MKKYICSNCRCSDSLFISNYIYKNKIFKNKKILKCTKCNLVHCYPLPKKKDLKNYNKNYFLFAHEAKKIDKISQAYLNSISKSRIQFIKNHSEKKINCFKDTLEIGPGNGFLAKNFNLKKFQNYDVVETDASLYKNLRDLGLGVYGNLRQISKKKYDLILASHVLEHLDNPIQFLKHIKKFLKKKGKIFLEVPCLDYTYKNIHEPHIFFFDRNTIKDILIKNKFKIVDISYYGLPINFDKKKNFFKSFKYIITKLILKFNLIDFFYDFKKKNYTIDIKREIILSRLFDMNIKRKKPAWWLRVMAKN